MSGDIKTEEGEAVLEGIDITLSQRGHSNVLSESSGHFMTTRVADIMPSEFKLEPADGRHGDVIVSKVSNCSC